MFKRKPMKTSEVSPFDWKKEDRQSIFAQDPRFTGRYKVSTPPPVTYKNVTWKI